MKNSLIIAGGVLVLAAVLVYVAYPLLEAKYQRDMDAMRRKHAHRIADVIQEFADQTGHLPFEEQAAARPFMVLIGHSPEHEEHFASDPVLKRDAQWAHSALLEAMLQQELKRKIQLPRDPQTVPTYAPNVYIYFVSGNQMTVISHLYYPDEQAVQYEWHARPFYSYTITYEFSPKPSPP